MKAVLTLVVLYLGFVFSACGYLEKKIDKDPFHLGVLPHDSQEEALDLILSLKKINQDLTTFKGVGSIELRHNEQTLNGRLMWIGDTPEKFRMELIGIHGQPVLRTASDGLWIYVYTLSDKKYYKLRNRENSLQQFLSIPVRLTTITELLMGRIPIPSHKTAAIIKNSSGDGYLLYVLEEKTGHIEKLFLDQNKLEVTRIEYTDSTGSLLYRVILDQGKNIDSYHIPFLLSITDGGGAGIKINVDRFWTDVDVNPSVFVLSPP